MNTIGSLGSMNAAASKNEYEVRPIAMDCAPPDSSALTGILRRVGELEKTVYEVHDLADRACGTRGLEVAQTKTQPQAVPNGLLDEIEMSLDSLIELSASAMRRLQRIA